MMEILLSLLGVLLMFLWLGDKFWMVYIQNFFFLNLFIYIMMNLDVWGINFWIYIYGDYALDKISFVMIILVYWILGLMVLSSLNLLYMNYFIFLMMMLMFSLIGLFMSLDLISFYLFFEVSLIPIMLMVLGWGGQPERLLSIFYLLMYTLFVSLPFLFLLIILLKEIYSLNLFLYIIYKFSFIDNFMLYFFMMMIFMVKLPIYFIHLWLPKAHVEAPIFGSMILAGVLLKMGGYGIMRVLFMMMNLFMKFNMIIISLTFIGSIIISLMCLSQVDLKMLIAYSSVVHMGFMLCGGLMMFYWGLMGFFLMMVAHGICSSGLFCLLNLNYKRIGSRSMILNSGMIMYFPKMSLMWFMFSVMNMASPPSLNLVSEIYLIIGVVKINIMMLILLFMLSLFSSIYSIYIYSGVQHGVNCFISKYLYNTIDEFMLMILHLIPLNLMIFVLWFFF